MTDLRESINFAARYENITRHSDNSPVWKLQWLQQDHEEQGPGVQASHGRKVLCKEKMVPSLPAF
jgi:hypothetical protein